MNRRLYRSPDDRIFAGIAGGMAETYDLDPAVVRIGWALLILLTGGVFLLLYILMIFFVPLRPAGFAPWPTAASTPRPIGPDGQPITPPPGPESADPNFAAGSATQPAAPHYYYRHREHRDGSAGLVFGVLLIAVGAFFLVREYIPAINFDLFWPLIVIAGGALLIVAATSRQRRPL